MRNRWLQRATPLTCEQWCANGESVPSGLLLALLLTTEPGFERAQRSRPFVQLTFDFGEIRVTAGKPSPEIIITTIHIIQVSLSHEDEY